MRILWRVLVVIVLIAAILGIGVYAYNVGIAQGLAQKVQVQAAPPVQIPLMYYGHPFIGFGFGLLGCLIPLFLLFLIFGSLRFLFWRGSMGMGHMHHRRWNWQDENSKDVPPFFAEWHHRAHAGMQAEKPEEKKE
jgi:hypothetical protein